MSEENTTQELHIKVTIEGPNATVSSRTNIPPDVLATVLDEMCQKDPLFKRVIMSVAKEIATREIPDMIEKLANDFKHKPVMGKGGDA